MFLRRPAHDRFVTLRVGGWVDFSAGRGGNTLFTSRPIIISMISLGLLLPAGKGGTWEPVRETQQTAPSSAISWLRGGKKNNARPSLRSWPRTPQTVAASAAGR